ncbi:fanconi-associated nuclease 1 homolog [Phtheirospermum japonicum]|uniref:Fanconi-associated nuclease n=1 Tax=Phtheirospermum japonicum TaxID=374723 RepID=A0A830D301_9LAMI|nr:fanconi-associated nuclease 1 homolog [Phtheirospermum japonicum]
MLTGRESLLRVIGKPRRFLPNRRSILSAASPSTSQSFLSLYQVDEILKREDAVDKGSDAAAESVDCPVCGARFPGLDNTLINSHLDVCLARGTKRKLSQHTLLQFNFSRSKVKIHSVQPVDKEYQKNSAEPDKNSPCDAIHNLNGLDKHRFVISPGNSPFACPVENQVANDVADNRFSSPSLLLDDETPKYVPEECLENCDVSKVFIPTSIVGRRYGSREELDSESRICLSRDPENVKDPNAIKVLYVDCEYDNMLGYIPRELAQYLSPLMDIFHLNFEGSITSVPKDSRAAVPIQIVCKNVELFDQIYSENIQEFKSLWRDALRVVELAKTNPSGMTRYLHNLVLLIQEVLKSTPHLFVDSEMSFLESFDSLPDDSKRLFARLYTRKGPWFRMSNISYPEVDDCHLAIEKLLEAGYISSFQRKNELEDNHLEEVLNTLNIDELRGALRVLKKKCNHGTRKQDIVDLLLSSSKDGLCPELQSFVLEVTGSCVKVSPLAESLLWRAERLFFLNGDQNLSAFSLVDLGIVKYPAYRCIISEPIFSNISDLLLYEEAIEVSQIMIESLDEDKSELVLRCLEISVSRMSISFEDDKSSSGKSMATFQSHFSASWVYSKVALLGVSFLEREKRYTDAINLLKQLLNTFISDRRRGYWSLRLSVDLEHLGRLDDSLQVAEDGLLDPWVRAGARIALQRRVIRLGKPPRRWKIPSYSKSVKRKILEVHVQGRPLNCKTGAKSIFYGEDGQRCGVEELALQYYAGEGGGGWRGVHSEGGIWLTIFGILMWDVIFADVPNVFHNKFQTAPLDLETDTFYEARKSLVEAHIDKIRDGMAEEILITSWESHVGTACRGVNWEKHSLPDLIAAVKCIGGHCLSLICRHLAQDYRSWSSGMPDLLLWRLHDDCYRGEAKLVEVKGPRDRLSEQQRAWLLVLMDCGFNVEVCKVTPAPVIT